MRTEIFSKGLYSTYLYVKEVNSCFDCGEGMTTSLGPRCFGIRKLFLSHGHHDHISGISSLIGARCVTRGDNQAPLDIYYPDGSQEILDLKEYISKSRQPTFTLKWVPITANTTIELESPNKIVRAFKVEHTTNSLGFSILEKRKKIKKEFESCSPQEFQRLHGKGVKVSDKYLANIWSYSGDAAHVDPKDISNAEWFFCDTTFLKAEDRKEKTHFSLDEAVSLAKTANIKRFIGIHISPRYSTRERKEYQAQIQRDLPKSILLPYTKPVTIDNHPDLNKARPDTKIVIL